LILYLHEVRVVVAVVHEHNRLLVVAAACLWCGGYWLSMNNGGLTLAYLLCHVVALLVDTLLDLDA
jgi:hypothetical protein